MEKLTALIIDDEPLAQRVILNYAQDIPTLEIIGQCYTAIEALDFLKQKNPDLIFLDIEMPKLQGLDFLRMLQPRPLIIVTTAFQEYALEGFELDVCDYLLKPFRFERFLKAVTKAQQLKDLQQNTLLRSGSDSSASPQQIFIKSNKKHIQIDLVNIYFIESFGNYIKIWQKENFHLSYMTLSAIAAELPAQQFLRIHKSYIVNSQHIDYLEGNQIFMRNAKPLAIGRNYQRMIKAIIGRTNG